MLFKDISYLELWLSFCPAVRNNLFKFGRGYQKEQFCEIILNLDQWFRCCLKDFLSGTLATLVFGSGTIYAIFVEGIMGHIHVMLF